MIIPIVMFYKLLPKNVSHAAGYSTSYVREFQYVIEYGMRKSVEEARSQT